jgi:hypothetical protein
VTYTTDDEFSDPNSEFNRGLDEYLEDQQKDYWASLCTVCSGRGEYNDAPGGGWWSHVEHPADDHDFKVRGELIEGPVCVVCGKPPSELPEYADMADPKSPGYEGYKSPDEAVRHNEGTYNIANGHFYCTADYIKVGMPLGVAP